MLPAVLSLRAHRGDHVGTHGADDAHHVAQHLLAAPPRERLFPAERVPEIDRAGEVLLGAVEPVRGQQLLGPQDRQGIEQLGADLVLAASPRVAVSSTARWPSPFESNASSALFSSSGCAVIIRNVPVLLSWRRARPSSTRPSEGWSGWLSAGGTARGTVSSRTTAAPTAAARARHMTIRVYQPVVHAGSVRAARLPEGRSYQPLAKAPLHSTGHASSVSWGYAPNPRKR